MLFELIIFAIVLVTLQMVAGVIIFKVMTSKKFMKSMTKSYIDLFKDTQDEIDELLWGGASALSFVSNLD